MMHDYIDHPTFFLELPTKTYEAKKAPCQPLYNQM